MQVRLPVLMTVALLICPSGASEARPPDGATAGAGPRKATHFVSIVKQQTGDLAVVVDYPWRAHQQPSVEIRLVTRRRVDLPKVRPLFFVKEFFRGTMMVNVYHCQDQAAGVPLSKLLTEKEIEFEIIGRRNALGRPAASVAHRIPGSDPAPGSGVVFCLLPAWSVNKGLLHLELPPQYFAQPGELYVWFLRGSKVVWEERADWPGGGKK